MSKQEQGQDQDRRGSEVWHPPGHTDSEVWRSSARVAWRLQWGLKTCIGLPPPPAFSGLCCRPVDPAKSYSAPPPIFPSQPLSPELRSGCWKHRSRTLGIAKQDLGNHSGTGRLRAEILPFHSSVTPGLSGTRSFGPGPHGR